MRNHSAFAALVGGVLLLFTTFTASAQETNQPTRTADGVPDLNGIWQAMGSAHWDLEAHSARKGPWPPFGALGAIPAGQSVVEGGKIPYTAEAAKQRAENREHWLKRDPGVKCFMPGIPRATYMPLPFQIVQSENKLLFAYEFSGASRAVRLDRPGSEAPVTAWMGYSLGRWEGDTLVVEVTDQMPDTWFDASGNFHSDELKVEERYRLAGSNTLMYEATITDSKTFTRPWKIKMPLYRRLEENAQLLEFKCVPFAEGAVYGDLYRGNYKSSDKNE